MNILTIRELKDKGIEPEILFWVGCAGSFDDRAKRITKSFASLLNKAGVSFAVLGKEESCTGDPAKRAGNEFLFQMQAVSNIEVLNQYNFKKLLQLALIVLILLRTNILNLVVNMMLFIIPTIVNINFRTKNKNR